MRRPADDEAALAEAVDGEAESDVRVLEVDEIKSVERVAAT